MMFSPPPSTVAIADQIAKGVDPNQCVHMAMQGYFRFCYVKQNEGEVCYASVTCLGGVSFEFLEMIEEWKPSEKRRAIKRIIRQLRNFYRFNVQGWEDV